MQNRIKNKNIEIELVMRIRIERCEETRTYNVENHDFGTIRCLGPDRQHGRRVYLCFGPYGYFVSSREADGSLTCRTASLKQAGIRPSQITLDLAIRLLDKIDKRYFRNNDE